jgi:hypothetical protein
VRFLLQALERPRLFQLPLQLRRHTQILCVITRIVKPFTDAHLACVPFSDNAGPFADTRLFTCFGTNRQSAVQ